MDTQPERSAQLRRGLISTADTSIGGLSRRQARYRRDVGRWELVRPTVNVVVGAPRTWEQSVLAAVMAGGAEVAVSHGTLARLLGHDVGQLDPEAIEVTAPLRRQIRIDGVRAHRSLHLEERDRRTWFGIPGTTAERLVCDLSSRLRERELDRLVDDLQREQRLQLPRLAATIARLGQAPGRSPATVRRILQARWPGYEPGDSHFEARVLRILRAAGLPLPRVRVRVRAGGEQYRLDMAYVPERLYVEADGWETHGARSAFDDDRRRLNALVISGWRPIHLTWRMTDEEIASTVAAALGLCNS
jgi:very-short-patch-repair endonuclease